eukprot:m.195093 g.195093  ORF g.195093 m.195093 type:complete len:913 (+) comp19382_c0_seq1:170-2908(+)
MALPADADLDAVAGEGYEVQYLSTVYPEVTPTAAYGIDGHPLPPDEALSSRPQAGGFPGGLFIWLMQGGYLFAAHFERQGVDWTGVNDGRQYLLGTSLHPHPPSDYFQIHNGTLWEMVEHTFKAVAPSQLPQAFLRAVLVLLSRNVKSLQNLLSPIATPRGQVGRTYALEHPWMPRACAHCKGLSGTGELAGSPLLACAGCKQAIPVYYCCRAHQRADWKAKHKSVCRGLVPLPVTADGDDEDTALEPIHMLHTDVLLRIFKMCVDHGSVSMVRTLALVCRQWCVVARSDALFRRIRMAMPDRDPRQATALWSRARGDYLTSIELCDIVCFENGPAKGVESFMATMLSLTILPLPNLTSLTLRRCFTQSLCLQIPLDTDTFYPVRRLVNKPGRKMRELRFLGALVSAVDLLDMMSHHAATLRVLEIQSVDPSQFASIAKASPPLSPEAKKVTLPMHQDPFPQCLPAAATVFGREEECFLGRQTVFFDHLTHLTLDLRRRTLQINDAFRALVELQSLDLAFSYVQRPYVPEDAFGGDSDGSQRNPVASRWAANGRCYPHLTDLTLRYYPCCGVSDFNGDQYQEREPPDDEPDYDDWWADMCAHGHRAYVDQGMEAAVGFLFDPHNGYNGDLSLYGSGLDFFLDASRRLKRLRLLYEGFEREELGFSGSTNSAWPLESILDSLRPLRQGRDRDPHRNPLEVLEVQGVADASQGFESGTNDMLAAFADSLVDVNLTVVYDGDFFDWETAAGGRGYMPVDVSDMMQALCVSSYGFVNKLPTLSEALGIKDDSPIHEKLTPKFCDDGRTAFVVGGAPRLRRVRVARLLSEHLKDMWSSDDATMAYVEDIFRTWAPGMESFEVVNEIIRHSPYPPRVSNFEARAQSMYNVNKLEEMPLAECMQVSLHAYFDSDEEEEA